MGIRDSYTKVGGFRALWLIRFDLVVGFVSFFVNESEDRFADGNDDASRLLGFRTLAYHLRWQSSLALYRLTLRATSSFKVSWMPATSLVP